MCNMSGASCVHRRSTLRPASPSARATTLPSQPRRRRLSGFILTRPTARWCWRWTRSRRSRRWSGLQQDYCIKVPRVLKGGIATYFNRAVVSAQSWLKLKNVGLQKQMEWLANGIQEALPNLLENSDALDCAIYHLSDNLDIAGIRRI